MNHTYTLASLDLGKYQSFHLWFTIVNVYLLRSTETTDLVHHIFYNRTFINRSLVYDTFVPHIDLLLLGHYVRSIHTTLEEPPGLILTHT
jgi:hypothetical protein